MADGNLRVICGPTAGGKSAFAFALSATTPLAVISADSRQVYRGFDIGTAKPTAGERSRVPHFGVDVAAPTDRYSAAAWAEGAAGWIAAARAMGRTPTVVGGTGFYIRALASPLFREPPLDPFRRAELAAELAPLTTEALRRRVERVDPRRARLGRAQLLRALEVATLTGRPLSAWHAEQSGAAPRVARYLLIDPGAPLAGRIGERVVRMLDEGWEQEVDQLMRAVAAGAPAWNATGYGVVRDLVRGRIKRATAIEKVTIATRQYAKRQRTWFRHQLKGAYVTRLDPDASDALERARAWWDGDDGGTDA